jgi:hypothetical protein
MPKNYIPYDLALKLKEKGYNKPSNAYYNIYNKEIFTQTPTIHNEAIWAPTFGEVINWFKEYHNINVEPNYESIDNALNKIK